MNYIASKPALKVVGTRPIRPDGVDKVTGRAQFGADMALPGMLWAKVVRSPHAHAKIVKIDASRALKLPGVKAVVTAADLPNIASEEAFVGEGPMNFRDLSRNCIARDKVLYEGHAVAAVAAISPGHRRGSGEFGGRDLRSPAVRHRRGRRDEGRRAAAPRRPVHRQHGAEADQAVQHRQARLFRQGRRRKRVQRRRRDRGRPLHDRSGPSGLYRAACLRGAGGCGRPGRGVQLVPGPVHGARLLRQAAGLGSGKHPRRAAGNRRRVRRQDAGLSGTARARAVEEDRARW